MMRSGSALWHGYLRIDKSGNKDGPDTCRCGPGCKSLLIDRIQLQITS